MQDCLIVLEHTQQDLSTKVQAPQPFSPQYSLACLPEPPKVHISIWDPVVMNQFFLKGHLCLNRMVLYSYKSVYTVQIKISNQPITRICLTISNFKNSSMLVWLAPLFISHQVNSHSSLSTKGPN